MPWQVKIKIYEYAVEQCTWNNDNLLAGGMLTEHCAWCI